MQVLRIEVSLEAILGIEVMVPEPSLGEYALGPGRDIYSGLERRREEMDSVE
jgi:hypothetical protein